MGELLPLLMVSLGEILFVYLNSFDMEVKFNMLNIVSIFTFSSIGNQLLRAVLKIKSQTE